MRLLLALLLFGFTLQAHACSCFSPELRAKTARETLALARTAVFARVLEVDAGGAAKVLVLESFKGPAKDATFEMVADPAQCAQARFTVGEEVLVLAFKDKASACDKHPSDHFLLEEFRARAPR